MTSRPRLFDHHVLVLIVGPLIDREHAQVREQGLGGVALDLAAAQRHRHGQQQIDPIAGKDKAGEARVHGDVDGDGAVAGRQHRGEEAAVARPHQAGLGDGLTFAQGRADDGADEILDLAVALDNISRRDPVLGPGLPAQILGPHELAGRERALGDQHARSHIGHDRRGHDFARRHPGAGDQHRGARNGEGDEHEQQAAERHDGLFDQQVPRRP